jgi:hypothetical protein
VGSKSISQWARSHGLSRGTYYLLQKEGKAPRTMTVRSRPRISDDADAEWVKAREEEHAKQRMQPDAGTGPNQPANAGASDKPTKYVVAHQLRSALRRAAYLVWVGISDLVRIQIYGGPYYSGNEIIVTRPSRRTMRRLCSVTSPADSTYLTSTQLYLDVESNCFPDPMLPLRQSRSRANLDRARNAYLLRGRTVSRRTTELRGSARAASPNAPRPLVPSGGDHCR